VAKHLASNEMTYAYGHRCSGLSGTPRGVYAICRMMLLPVTVMDL